MEQIAYKSWGTRFSDTCPWKVLGAINEIIRGVILKKALGGMAKQLMLAAAARQLQRIMVIDAEQMVDDDV